MSENDKDNKINFDEDFKKLLDEIKDEAVTFFNKKEKTEFIVFTILAIILMYIAMGHSRVHDGKRLSLKKKARLFLPTKCFLLNFRLFRFRDALFFRGFLRRL